MSLLKKEQSLVFSFLFFSFKNNLLVLEGRQMLEIKAGAHRRSTRSVRG